jgi:hypothetical protein
MLDYCGDAFSREKSYLILQNYLCVAFAQELCVQLTQVAFLSQKPFLVLVSSQYCQSFPVPTAVPASMPCGDKDTSTSHWFATLVSFYR